MDEVITLLGIDIDSKEDVEFTTSVLKSQDMQELCGKLLIPALGRLAHESIRGDAAGTKDFEAGRYDMLAELIGFISE